MVCLGFSLAYLSFLFLGQVGIDAYSWLHKGGEPLLQNASFDFEKVKCFKMSPFSLFLVAYSCSMQLCLDISGDVANRYLSYFMHHINLLRHHQITPVVVFDGGKIPCKSATEHERQRQVKEIQKENV